MGGLEIILPFAMYAAAGWTTVAIGSLIGWRRARRAMAAIAAEAKRYRLCLENTAKLEHDMGLCLDTCPHPHAGRERVRHALEAPRSYQSESGTIWTTDAGLYMNVGGAIVGPYRGTDDANTQVVPPSDSMREVVKDRKDHKRFIDHVYDQTILANDNRRMLMQAKAKDAAEKSDRLKERMSMLESGFLSPNFVRESLEKERYGDYYKEAMKKARPTYPRG